MADLRRVTPHRRVHPAVEPLELSGVLAQKVRGKDGDARSDSFGVRRADTRGRGQTSP